MADTPQAGDWIRIDRLTAFGIVGLHAWERERTQEIVIDASLRVGFERIAESDDVRDGVNYADVSREMIAHAETIERHTIEALAADLAGIALSYPGVSEVVVRVAKPRADPRARTIGVEVRRLAGSLDRTAYVGLGSNADAEANLPRAVDAIRLIGEITGVSRVYQTPAEGDRSGPDYLNAAVAVRTPLPAGALVRRFKAIERELGRDRERSPERVPIDIDLCLLGDQTVQTGGLSIPRPEVLERGYLALTLSEVGAGSVGPKSSESLGQLARRLNGDAPPRVRDDIHLMP